MDPPLPHSSADVYQIHRTPFFRRVHRKDSGEFERLRQAYESVRNFDEKPLEAQVKKIRLGNLLNRIKDSLTSAKHNGSNKPRNRAKTKQEMRQKELNHLEDWKKEKSRLERRLKYGNTRSQVNIRKMERNQSAEGRQESNIRGILEAQSTPTSKKRLLGLKKRLTREEFFKYLLHCLSADQLNAEAMRTFREILQTRGDMYWDLVEAIDQRQQYIKLYSKFMKKLSNLAQRDGPEMKPETARSQCVETFDSKTSVRPSCCQSPEVVIRTYRYSDDDAFLPPPSLSLLQVHEETVERDESDSDTAQTNEPKTMPAASVFSVVRKSSSHLSAKLMETIRTDPTIKSSLSQKFGDIIRDTVLKESALMLHNLEQAIKH